ncbi:MAG: glycosyl transferase family 2 [Acidimicrobiia bacterium]|nr:glycosyl transferase family 2 [Acidimicrobiia bacterium]
MRPESLTLTMPKLIIQIPCLNEAEQLPATLADLPRHVDGFDTVEWLIIDDGSTDHTAEVARACGADHVLRLPVHRGLAVAFQAGMDAALKLGADVIVNTDADNQYAAGDIPALAKPVLSGEADVVVGDRGVRSVNDFSWLKRRLQRFGSRVVSQASGIDVPDATSGFRAYNREAATRLFVHSSFTYTLESLIQAGRNGLAVSFVPVSRQKVDRPSRLFKSNSHYIRKSVGTILRLYAFYRPLQVFAAMATALALGGMVSWMPFIGSWIHGRPGGHLQSIVLGSVLWMAALQMLAIGIVADLIGKQRAVSEKTLERVRRIEMHSGVPPLH